MMDFNIIKSKIAIGTVQFGLNYGISNAGGKTSPNEVAEILSFADSQKIYLLDTARAYGDSEAVLGNVASQNFKIVSKFGTTPREDLTETLAHLKRPTIYGYLSHNADHILENPNLWNVLDDLKSEGLTERIGYSLYSTSQLESLIEHKFIPDIIQVPYNLLDSRFSYWIDKLKNEYSTEIHVRSVFLQGLFFMNTESLEGNVVGLKKELIQLHKWSKEYNLDIGTMALNYALQNQNIDYVVIGVNSKKQLIQNLESVGEELSSDLIHKIGNLKKERPILLNPSNW